jgi:hypothetical protein
LVLAAFWISTIGVVTLQDHYSGRGLTDEELGITPQMKSMTWEGAEAGKPPPFELTVPVATFDPTKPYEVLRPPINYPRVITLSLAPPGLMLLLGCAGWWVLRGFKQ